MATEFIRGKKLKFIAEISFGLNWDDKDMKSVKIKKGQEVLYDGEVAVVENGAGVITGRCMGLKSAINVMEWLKPAENGHVSKAPKGQKVISDSLFGNQDYDAFKGGNFDVHMNRESGRKIIKEEDLIVKEIPSLKTNKRSAKSGKLEIAGDQVEVPKERLVVSSSTIRTRTEKRNVEVTRADEMGADATLPFKSKVSTPTQTPEKKSFTVDDTTPRQIRDDMTHEEVKRFTKPKVINADDSQDAKVIKKIDTSKEPVQQVEGIVLKKISSPKDVKFNRTTSPGGLTIKTTVGAGSNSAAGSQGVVVGVSKAAKNQAGLIEPQEEAPPPTEEEKKIAAEKLAEREKKAKARAESRKKKAVETQKLMEKSKKVDTLETEKVPDLVEEIKQEDDNVKIGGMTETTDYLLMLPDNWNKMHWVKKEKFIKEINDIFFIKFVLSMELTKVVKNACLERLKELEQKKSG